MASMTFTINDQWTDGTPTDGGEPQPVVQVTITENANGTLSFSLAIVGDWTGDLRGLFFDINEALLGTLSVANVTPTGAITDSATGDDSVTSLGNDAAMTPLYGSDGGYDIGLEIGTSGAGNDVYTGLSFTLASTAGPLTLADVAGQDFGIRVTSVNDGGENFSSKILEHTSPVLDPQDDEACVDENATTAGNVFDNDANAAGNVNSVSGSAVGTTVLTNAAGATFTLNADGSYVLDASTADALSLGEHLTYTIAFAAESIDAEDETSWSTDAGTITICVDGVNDDPTARDDASLGCVDENSVITGGNVLANDSDIDRLDTISLVSWQGGALGSSLLIDDAEGATVALNANGSWTVDAGGADALGAGEHITQSYTYTISDNNDAQASAIFTVEVCGVNDGPQGNDDSPDCVNEDATGTGNVLANDSDVDRNDQGLLTVASWTGGNLGDAAAIAGSEGATVALNGDGSWILDANAADALGAGEHASQTFSYTVADGHGGSATANFTVEVCGVNDGPVADDESLGCVTDIGGAYSSTESVLVGDTDVDRNDVGLLTVAALAGVADGGEGDLDANAGSISVQLASGSIVTMDAAGNFTYDSSSFSTALYIGQHADDSFEYTLADGHGGTDIGTVSLEICGQGKPDEGLSQGFWKTHSKEWDLATNTSYEAFFGVEGTVGAGKWITGQKKDGSYTTSDGITFMKALDVSAYGSAQTILAKQAVAAVLNAAEDDFDINFKYSVSDVVSMVQEATAQGDAAMLALGQVLENENTLGLWIV